MNSPSQELKPENQERYSLGEKHTADMSFLKERNLYLRSHMEFLRKKIEDQNRQIERFAELIVSMDEKSKIRKPLDLRQLNLN